MQPEDFFAGHPVGLAAYHRVCEIVTELGPFETRTGLSQVAFRRRRGFAYLWRPDRYLRRPAAEVVLSIALGRHETSTRFKQVAHPAPRVWMHHLELTGPADIDGQAGDWLREAYERAA